MDGIEEYSPDKVEHELHMVVTSCPAGIETISTVISDSTMPPKWVVTVVDLSEKLKNFSIFTRIFLWLAGLVCFRKTLAIAGMTRSYDVEYHTKLSAYGVEYSGEIKLTKRKRS